MTKSPSSGPYWPLVGERVLPPPRASVEMRVGVVKGPASVALGVGSGEGP